MSQNNDVHNKTVSKIFDVDPDEVTPEQRRAARVINFGVIYGRGCKRERIPTEAEGAEAVARLGIDVPRLAGDIRARVAAARDPALQNIPLRTCVGEAVRVALIPPVGSVSVPVDYTQLELRLLALFAENKGEK